MTPRVVLHIGTHKTGTTSIQHFLKHERQYFERNGYSPILGIKGKPNFKELFHATVSSSRLRNFALRKSFLPRWYWAHRVRKHIKRKILTGSASNFIVSSELLSFLRERREIQKIKNLFPPGSEFTVIVSLRNKTSFLASYKKQLGRQGMLPASEKTSSKYVESDSWLVDYDSLLAAYSSLSPDVRIIDFDDILRRNLDVIGEFCALAGIRELPPKNSLVRLNQSATQPLERKLVAR